MNKIFRLSHARCLEFFRDKEALAWNLLMPIILVVSLALAFGNEPQKLFTIAVVTKTPINQQALPMSQFIQYYDTNNIKSAQTKLAQHQVDLVISHAQNEYWYNPHSEKSVFLNDVFSQSETEFTTHAYSGAKLRYIDWVFPGVLAIHIMYSALYGVAFVIVRYRKNGYLKRLQATPLSAFEFLAAQIISRLLISGAILILVYFSCVWLLHPIMHGNLFTLFFIYLSGTFCLIAIALVICARTSSEELSRGLLEIVAWPMLLISGAWFSLDQAHISLQWLSQILPLTHLINAARAVMLEGASMVDVAPQFLLLLGTGIVFLVIGSISFKWR